MIDLLAKIEQGLTEAGEFGATTVADGSDAVSRVLDKLSHAFSDTAAFLRTGGHIVHPAQPTNEGGQPANPPVGAAAPNPVDTAKVFACCDRLTRVKEKCEQQAHPAVQAGAANAAGGPLMDAVLAQLVATAIDAVTTWLRRRTQPTA